MVLGQQLFLNPFKAHIEVEAPSLGADMDFARLNFLELQNSKLQDDFIREKRDRSRLEAELEMERGELDELQERFAALQAAYDERSAEPVSQQAWNWDTETSNSSSDCMTLLTDVP